MEIEKNYKIQILRAIAIFAVVFIHTCPIGEWQVFCRPFINFAVALFLFLSGYLTKTENDNWFNFFKKRIIRVIIPYIIWTILYSLASALVNGLDLKRILINLVTTKSTGTLYYIYVYIQFVLLTPILVKIAKSKYRWVVWLIAPISIIIFKYFPLLSGEPLNKYISVIWDVSCLGWMSYYYLGLLLGNQIIQKNFNIKKLCALYVISIPLQMLEGYGWLLLGDTNCGTQLKITSLVTNALFLLICYKFIISDKLNFKNKLLIFIGNCSFGIYLSHIMVMNLLKQIDFYLVLPYFVNSIIVIMLTLICVIIGQKVLGKKISKWFGLV